jgi:hypothetical protein
VLCSHLLHWGKWWQQHSKGKWWQQHSKELLLAVQQEPLAVQEEPLAVQELCR